MTRRSLFSVADHVLVHDLDRVVAHDCAATAEMLELIAEVDSRKLYARAGYPSMYQYLVRKLHMSEDAALKRPDAARAARQLPAIFDAVAEGRLNLSGLMLLLPHLKTEIAKAAHALLVAATHKTNTEIRVLLADRYPMPDVPTLLQAVQAPVASEDTGTSPACEEKELVAVRRPGEPAPDLNSNPIGEDRTPPATIRVESPAPHSRVAPLAPKRFALQTTIDGDTQELLRRAQDLIGRGAPAADIPQVLKAALTDFVAKLEKKRFAATAKPRPRRGTPKGRHIPAEVKRAVRQRDGNQCTFVRDNGTRCCATSNLEFDHIDPIARGGQATLNGLRLLCRAHNQFMAERAFGAGFMQEKREVTRHEAARKRTRMTSETPQPRPSAP